jgi:hypothetical protein
MLIGRMLVLLSQLLMTVLFLTLISPMGQSIGMTLATFTKPRLGGSERGMQVFLVIFTSVTLALVITYMVWTSRLVSRYARIFFNVRFLKSFLESIPDDLRDQGLERIILCAARERAIPASSWEAICKECRKSHDDKPPCETEPPAQIEGAKPI